MMGRQLLQNEHRDGGTHLLSQLSNFEVRSQILTLGVKLGQKGQLYATFEQS